MKATRGLTLIELVATVAIVTLLAGIALPAFSAMLEGTRAAEARGSLLTSLSTAATKAVLSGRRTVICPSATGSDCSDSPDWTRGWIVFLDKDADRDRDADETVVYRRAALPGKVHLRSTTGRTRITFQGSGSNAGSNVTFTLCDGRGPRKAVSLIVSNQGQLRQAPASQKAAQACAG